jgi:hypothetical protein
MYVQWSLLQNLHELTKHLEYKKKESRKQLTSQSHHRNNIFAAFTIFVFAYKSLKKRAQDKAAQIGKIGCLMSRTT